MTNKHNENKLYNILLLMISLFFIEIIVYLSRNAAFFGDDLSYGLYSRGIFDMFLLSENSSLSKIHGGGYLCLFLTGFFNFHLPNMLNMHPSDFISAPHGVIKGVFYCLIVFSIINFSQVYKKSKLVYILLFSYVFLYSISVIININSFVISTNHAFYRYLLPLVFFSFFWSYIYKNIIFFNIKQSNIKLISASICGLIIGTSIEILFGVSILLSLFIIVWNLFHIKSPKIYRYNLNKNFYIPISCLYAGVIAFTSSEGFKSVANVRGMGHISLNLSDIKEFCTIFFQMYIADYIIIWVLFIVCAVVAVLLSGRKRYNLKKVIFPLIMQFSITVIIFSLILCGKTYYEEGKFWLAHPNIQALYSIIILYGLLMLYSFAARYFSFFIKDKKIITAAAIILFTLAAGYTIFDIYKKLPSSYCYNNDGLMAIAKRNNYIAEKIFRFYYLQNKIPVLPIELNNWQNPLPDYSLWYRDCKITQENCCEESIFNLNYYPRVYEHENAKTVKYCFSKTGWDDYFKQGGKLGTRELKNIRFGNLYDKDFVKGKKTYFDLYRTIIISD